MTVRIIHIVLCFAAVSLPFWAPTSDASSHADDFPGWPTTFEGRPLEPVALDETELEFERGFPGKIGVFHQAERHIVIHWIAAPTRAFHFSGLCLKGRGWTLEPRPRETGDDGKPWAVREARKGNERAHLRQRIVDAAGNCWFDESTWYWATLRGDTTGPWTAWTVVSPASGQ